jgi:hypothetical protein
MALPPLRQQRFTTLAFNPPLHAIFEAISGFTSTGLSMSQDASALPYRLQWWRSFSEWVGGVGAIVLSPRAKLFIHRSARKPPYRVEVAERNVKLILVRYLALALIEPSEEHYAFYSAEARTRQLGESLKETVAESGSFLSRTRYWLLGRFGWPACHPGKRSIMV